MRFIIYRKSLFHSKLPPSQSSDRAAYSEILERLKSQLQDALPKLWVHTTSISKLFAILPPIRMINSSLRSGIIKRVISFVVPFILRGLIVLFNISSATWECTMSAKSKDSSSEAKLHCRSSQIKIATARILWETVSRRIRIYANWRCAPFNLYPCAGNSSSDCYWSSGPNGQAGIVQENIQRCTAAYAAAAFGQHSSKT